MIHKPTYHSTDYLLIAKGKCKFTIEGPGSSTTLTKWQNLASLGVEYPDKKNLLM